MIGIASRNNARMPLVGKVVESVPRLLGSESTCVEKNHRLHLHILWSDVQFPSLPLDHPVRA
jgi:hypothetical protein